MKNLFKIIGICLVFCSIKTNAQTLTALQQQNARATGYAIVAARNPGKSFSVYMIKWDGVHDLEYNANNQINPGWHPQAAVKGNYFYQTFVDNDFTNYSSVIVSQTEFDTYKSAGTDWWIVCSTLPSFSNSSLLVSDNGNVSIGTINPINKFESVGNESSLLEAAGFYNTSIYGNANDKAETRINLGKIEGSTRQSMGSIGAFPENNTDSSRGSLVFYTRESQTVNERLRIISNGNVGIGTTNPTSKLTVAGNINAREVKVTVDAGADFVFEKDYDLPSLTSLDAYLKENKHLPEIASAKEMQANGINLSEMNIKLLQKIEELTLYTIEQNKKIIKLEKDNEKILVLEKKIEKLELTSK